MPADGGLTVLALGDVVGKPGRRALADKIGELVAETGAGFVLVNGENASGGLGLRPAEAEEMLALPIDVLSSGNHIWRYKEIRDYLDDSDRLLRPANYPPGSPGRGFTVQQAADGTPVAVLNLQGLLFMEDIDCPFRCAAELLGRIRDQAAVVLVDFHAEATSEKRALGHYLDGRVSAVLGSHTHVPTADAEVLTGGTGYLSDMGMCGPTDSVIGVRKQPAVDRFLTRLPSPFQVANGGLKLQGAVLQIDPASGRCQRIDQRSWPLAE